MKLPKKEHWFGYYKSSEFFAWEYSKVIDYIFKEITKAIADRMMGFTDKDPADKIRQLIVMAMAWGAYHNKIS